MEMLCLISVCGVNIRVKIRIEEITKWCGSMKGLFQTAEMLLRFGHIKWMVQCRVNGERCRGHLKL